MLASDAHRFNFAFEAAGSKSGCNQYPVQPLEVGSGVFRGQLLRVNPLDLDFGAVLGSGVNEGFADGLVRVLELDVLTNQANADFALRIE